MAHVLFTDRFDYRVRAGVTIAYKAGWSGSVKRDCARKAIAAKVAEEIPAPPRTKKGSTDGKA